MAEQNKLKVAMALIESFTALEGWLLVQMGEVPRLVSLAVYGAEEGRAEKVTEARRLIAAAPDNMEPIFRDIDLALMRWQEGLT